MDRLEQLRTFYHHHHRLPSFSEMMILFKLKSKNSVYRIMQTWVKAGFFIRKDGKYQPSKRLFGVPLLGTIGAGFPSPAEEELTDAITLDDYLIHNRSGSFIVRVSGDSMIGAGIHPGDLVIVERSKSPKPGDIVIANIDTAWTLKRYMKSGTTVWLQPENKQYRPLYPKNELRIEGVVIGVVRKYH